MRIKKFSKRINFLLVIFIGLIMLSINLSAMISSRIEGVVYDKDTGKPIEGAKVYVIWGRKMGEYVKLNKNYSVIETDKDGKFVYHVIRSDNKIIRELFYGKEYFIEVFKKGYASRGIFMSEREIDYERFIFSRWDIFGGMKKTIYLDKEVEKEFGKGGVKIDYIGVKIGEGDVKHLRIGMEKESVIRIKIKQRFPGEEEKYCKYIDTILMYHDKYGEAKRIMFMEREIDGLYEIRGLRSGRVKIYISVQGYPGKVEEFYLKKGEVREINYVADFTKGQVVKWRMIDKKTGKTYVLNVHIYNALDKQKEWPSQALIDENNICWAYFPEPGRYRVSYGYMKGNKSYYVHETISIKPNEKKYIVKEF